MGGAYGVVQKLRGFRICMEILESMMPSAPTSLFSNPSAFGIVAQAMHGSPTSQLPLLSTPSSREMVATSHASPISTNTTPTLPFILSFPSTSATTSILMDTVLAAQKKHQQEQASVPKQEVGNSRSSPPNILKGYKCVGCGSESAIRVHYGASSCHGCKAFFRRSVFEGRVYMCSAENNCDITNESRNRCRACRLRNCLDGGMNPKHVREERSKIERLPPGSTTCTVSATNGVSRNPSNSPTTNLTPIKNDPRVGSPIPMETQSTSSEAEVGDRRVVEEDQLTLFMCALERQTELLTDDDVTHNEEMCAWSRDISLTFGLQHPQMVIKRLPLIYKCDRIMEATDLYVSWYRSFVFCADWAMGIPEFRILPLSDQTTLFKQNFMAFGWITFAYKCYELRQEKIGIPLGNGAYIPYGDEGQRKLPKRWAATYGVVCRKLIELIVSVMLDLKISVEEYCLIKTISLFQQDCFLTDGGSASCTRMRDRLLEALSTHIEKRFPHYNQTQKTTRALKISLMLPSFSHIGQIESTLIQQLTAADLHQLSGVPMEICAAQQQL